MKTTKKLVSLLLALVMVFALAVSVSAATVTNKTTHSYDAYQIFSGTQAAGDPALGDVAWGTGINPEAFLNALKADNRFGEGDANIFASCTSAANVAAVLGGYTDKSDVAQAFANVAAQHFTAIKTAIASDANSVDLPAGYYLLIDTTDVSGGSDARNTALLQVTNKGDITIEKKYDVPSVDKSVTDSDGDDGDNREAADYSIGSDVPFTLTGTLPSNYDDYETYFYQFNDTLSSGLDYNDDAKVYVVNGETKTNVTDSFTIVEAAEKANTPNLTITCANLKAITGVTITKDSKIVVEYTAKLTAGAEIGQPGNSNKVTLTYSNDPNHSGSGTPSTGTTPEDTVLVFTYELDVTKVDGQDPSKKLKDAEFVLMDSTKTKVAQIKNGKVVGWDEDSSITKNADGTYPADYTLKSAETTGLVVIAGLDAGTYYLKETKAPSGYNKLDNEIKIVISATLDKSENNPALTALTISVNDGNSADGNLETGIVATDVQNNQGATLPETGGMGTTLFYIVGGILVLAAVVLFVTKRRMSAEK